MPGRTSSSGIKQAQPLRARREIAAIKLDNVYAKCVVLIARKRRIIRNHGNNVANRQPLM
jgi:hypothetical protein